MFGIGITELLIILAIIMIIFGVGKLPQIGEGLGKAISGFKKGVSEIPKIENIETPKIENIKETSEKTQ
ncbi:MAG: twin-arginine translocase TatA/TatE family subunit [Nitrospirae bacterium]|nr:twin-arginine translocase TatA/TatE family subunit [Nitrospirota bacterium]